MHPTTPPSGQSLWTKSSEVPSAPTRQEPASKPFTWDAVATGAREPGQQQQEQQVNQREGVEAGQASCGERRQLARPHRGAGHTPDVTPDCPHHPRNYPQKSPRSPTLPPSITP